MDSLVSQSHYDFEIIVVEDPPYDETSTILESYNDPRIKYIRNSSYQGLSESRNISVRHAEGEYLFFTDADCIAHEDWIKTGLRSFEENDCLGIEGKIYYVSESYEPTYSDHVVRNRNGNQYMTANMAYRKSAIELVGGFDRDYTYHEDRDLAIRILRHGDIRFNPNMKIYHQQSTWTPLKFFQYGKISRNRVRLYKKVNIKLNISWRIMFPINLLELLFPPILLGFPLIYRFKSVDDWLILLATYPKLLYERLSFWDECIKLGVFMI